jgi:hypothetical protein
VSLTSGLATKTEIGRLLDVLSRSLEQIRDARIAKGQPAENLRDELLADQRVPQLAEEMKNTRERVLYVDFDESNSGWVVPQSAFGSEVKELAWLLIAQVSNSYSLLRKNLLTGTHAGATCGGVELVA